VQSITMPSNVNNNVRETFAKTIIEVGMADPRLVCIVSDISHFRLLPLAEARPNQYFNLGVCENSIVNLAAGMAAMGKIPVIHTFASFLIDRSFEQLKISFGYHKLPVNIIVIGSGNEYAFHGVTHHSYADACFVKTIEGSEVYNPGSSLEFDHLFRSVYANGQINLFRATTQPHNLQVIDDVSIVRGEPVIVRSGHGGTLICSGGDLHLAIQFCERYPELDIEVVYLHTLKPINPEKIVSSLQKTRKLVTMEHQSRYGGLYGDILKIIAESDTRGVLSREVSLNQEYCRNYGSFQDQNLALGFSVENLKSLFDELHVAAGQI